MPQQKKPRHIPIRPDWLDLREEPALDPEQLIIDAHHHLWVKPGSLYLREEMAADISSGHNVVATVFSEGKEGYCTEGPLELRSLGETEYVAAIAEASLAQSGGMLHIAAGISGYVDMTLGAAAGEILDRHAEVAKGRFRGVRNTSAWHPDPDARGSIISPPPGLLYDREFRRGLAELAVRGMVFDAWMYHTQLAELADLAHAMPNLQIVLNHQGGPIVMGLYEGRRDEVLRDWDHFMRKLAGYGNISVKLGGLGMPMAGFDFHERPLPPSSDELASAWGPCLTRCIDIFGPGRCMFESNFPVDKGTTSYLMLWNAFKKVARSYSDAERHDLFFGTAKRTYTLQVDV